MFAATGFRCPHTLGHVVYIPPEIIQIISCPVCSYCLFVLVSTCHFVVTVIVRRLTHSLSLWGRGGEGWGERVKLELKGEISKILLWRHQFQFQELHLKDDVTETITRPTRTSCHKDQNQNQRGQKLQHLQDFQYSQDLTAAHQVSLFHPFVFLMQRF